MIFLLVYCYFVSNFISLITLIPVVAIIVLNAMIFTLSARENIAYAASAIMSAGKMCPPVPLAAIRRRGIIF